MKQPLVQHKATILVGTRQVEIHAPPFVPVASLDDWLATTLSADGVKLVSKTWDTTPPEAA